MVRIEKIMSKEVPTLGKGAKFIDAAKLISSSDKGCVVIVEKGELVGIVTESDIVKGLISKRYTSNEMLGKIMSFPVTTIKASTKMEKAGKIIDTKHFRRYPVVKEGKLVGLVTGHDVFYSINREISFHRNIQNIVLIIFVIYELLIFVFYKHFISFF